ncbi:HXXEE domain-containing protein [Thermococcus sp. 101 C5]|uniref:HXXEE domain-containing protein n=1 Tax=Thermococcus sp. 101 C5 TaxID=2654197 RepID=UPI00128C24F4|nr:HXXEE domain-containing protein [Thermococcus sp. 101 C5]MPW39104.1 HXXEE domain-containing protein [Thermococcus sp. 101 C5]
MKPAQYYEWLKREWAKVGLILSIYLVVFLFVFVRNYDFVVFLILLQTPLYMLHQTEEYVFPGGFDKFFNTKILKTEAENGPLNPTVVFFLNVLLIWVALPLFGLLSTINYKFGLWIPYFSLFAGIAHILLSIRARRVYNPGLFVSLSLNIPVSLWSIIFLMNQGILSSFLNFHFVIGLAINASLPIMAVILLRNYRKRETLTSSKS